MLRLGPVIIDDTFAEGFRMWAARVVVTADDAYWLNTAVSTFSGYGTSVIACDAEVGRESYIAAEDTPDGRVGAAVLVMGFNAEAITKALPRRVGQCLLTCPTVAAYDGLPLAADRVPMGKQLRFFGDGFQKSKVIAGRRYWRVPVMEGEFVCEDSVGAQRAVGGGNFLIQSVDVPTGLRAARAAVAAISELPGVITPFPGGVVRSGSKVGSRYKGLVASTNHEFCPAVRSQVATALHPDAQSCLEIVVNGLTESAVSAAIRTGIVTAAAVDGVVAISAGNYGGKLGKFHFRLHEILLNG